MTLCSNDRHRLILRQLQLLHAMGPIPDPERATLTVADLDGRERSVIVEAGPALSGPWGEGRLPCPDGWVFLPDTLATPLPLSLRNVGASYWFAHLPEHRMVYAQLNLVLDVRWCPGGNTFLLLPLLHHIAGSPKLSARGGLFVIIGRRTSSAAQNLVTLLDRHARPIFVGEPTGSSPNFVGESVPSRCPTAACG